MPLIPTEAEIVDILKDVKDPETGNSLYDLGMVRYMDYRVEDRTLVINIDFRRRTPSCAACAPLAWFVQKGITDGLSRELLRYRGIEHIEFTDR